ncbi:MAG: hypothetical protein ACRDTE_16615 [Pseudonocardiaceae bacterium]
MAEKWISQTDRRRVAVEGRLAAGGGPCTMLFVQDGEGWLVHPFGLDRGAVRMTRSAVHKLVDGLGAGQGGPR